MRAEIGGCWKFPSRRCRYCACRFISATCCFSANLRRPWLGLLADGDAPVPADAASSRRCSCIRSICWGAMKSPIWASFRRWACGATRSEPSSRDLLADFRAAIHRALAGAACRGAGGARNLAMRPTGGAAAIRPSVRRRPIHCNPRPPLRWRPANDDSPSPTSGDGHAPRGHQDGAGRGGLPRARRDRSSRSFASRGSTTRCSARSPIISRSSPISI